MENLKTASSRRNNKNALAVTREVFERETFKRHVAEIAAKENVPIDVVDTILKDFLLQIVNFIFMFPNYRKRIRLYKFMNIEVLPEKFYTKKFNQNSKP